jgi:hypothetical protein
VLRFAAAFSLNPKFPGAFLEKPVRRKAGRLFSLFFGFVFLFFAQTTASTFCVRNG